MTGTRRPITAITAVGALLVGALFAATAAPASAQTASTASTRATAVIVRASAALGPAEHAVEAAGGHVDRELRLIDGFAAHVPSDALPALRTNPAILGISADGSVTFDSTTTPYSASNDFGSMFNVVRSIGANQLWNQHASGQGIGVALLDTGVAPVPGLTAGNVVNGPDLSLDAGRAASEGIDEFGHGTHLAGIIAGRDSSAANYGAYNNPSYFTGVAPDATVVNVKIGAADGAVDVSQVIAGLDWVVAHKNDPGLNIRVVNLSFGTNSQQSYLIDPLAYAAEQVWRSGIVVVVAAGNEGNTTSILSDPAIDPYVLAVGADGHYDKDGNKLYVSSFSNAGNPTRHPDLVAPGQSIVSLRNPGSFADSMFAGGRVNDPAGRFFRGSGTSQSAAVVSGAVATLLSRYPTLTPDQVKGLLMAYATPIAGVSSSLQGAGEINLSKLAGLTPSRIAAYTQTWTASSGTGSLEAARGGVHLVGADGTLLTGETTVFGVAFDGHSWRNNAWDAASWQGGSWTASDWTGHSWRGDAWDGHSWSSDNWAGHSWSADTWDGHSWRGHSWSASDWSSDSWTGSTWSDTQWG